MLKKIDGTNASRELAGPWSRRRRKQGSRTKGKRRQQAAWVELNAAGRGGSSLVWRAGKSVDEAGGGCGRAAVVKMTNYRLYICPNQNDRQSVFMQACFALTIQRLQVASISR